MTFKLFLTASISASLIAFPANMIGCGPTEDPRDYFTSFFSRNNLPQKDLIPFYYTAIANFYDDDFYGFEEINEKLNEAMTKEWKQYCGGKVSNEEVNSFVFGSSADDNKQFYLQLTSGQQNHSSLASNAMAKYLLYKKDIAAFQYLQLAKQSEKYSDYGDWDQVSRKDSLPISQLIASAQASYKQQQSTFLKNRFAFQICKLSFYNRRFADCAKWYDENFRERSSVQELALSYKAGSLYRAGKNKEAAYAFSQLFANTSVIRKKDVFLGFLWTTNYCDPDIQDEYLQLCKTNQERATMTAMFAMYSSGYRLGSMRKVYALDKNSFLLPLIASREINKLEEKYLTPVLSQQDGGKAYYYSWNNEKDISENKKQLQLVIQFLQSLAHDEAVKNRGFYLVSLSYVHFLNKDFAAAKASVSEAQSSPLSQKLKDQLQLINLLIAANESPSIDAATEQDILPSLEWLSKKSTQDEEYIVLYRNFLTEILAQRYEAQGQAYKAALCYGIADEKMEWWNYAIDYLHEEMSSTQLVKLYNAFGNKTPSAFDKFLFRQKAITRNKVVNSIGTAYLRDYDFANAVKWLKRSSQQDTLSDEAYNPKTQNWDSIFTDPFYDYVNDYERYNKKSPTAYTKLKLAQKLLDLQNSLSTTTDKDKKARLYYSLATGLYNISFYGNSWYASEYYRHTAYWNTGNYDTPWETEYYGVHKAKDYFQKAYELTTNKEFKAACYFQVIKCAQRQVVEDDQKIFNEKFKYSPLFGNFKTEFGNTKYFTYVFNRCSFLRDFVKESR